MVPTTRAAFKDFCLRELGHPVLKINIDDDHNIAIVTPLTAPVRPVAGEMPRYEREQ